MEGPVFAESPRGDISVALVTRLTNLAQKFTNLTGEIEAYL